MKKENPKNPKQTCWRSKSKLEKKLTISLSLSLLLLIGFIAFVAYKYFFVPKPCTTPGCLLAASQIISHIDPSVDPCENFFEFSCGNFIKHIHGDTKASSVNELDEQIERQLSEIVKEPIKEDDHFLVKKQKEILKICMNETEEDGEEATNMFNATLEELGGWPVTVGPLWNSRFFDWKELVYKLTEKGYPHNMMLHIGVFPDVIDRDKTALYVSYPYLPKIEDDEKEFYKQYMIDIAVKFGANEDYAAVEMEKVLDFMERLSDVADKDKWNTDNGTRINITAELMDAKFTIQEYQNNYTQINWVKHFNNILKPNAKVSETDYAFFPKSEFMDAFFDLIERTPGRIQANYMIWNIIEIIIPYLSKDLQEIENNYACLTKAPQPRKDRFKFCNKIFDSIKLNPLPSNIIYARKYLPKDKKEDVEGIYKNIKNEFIELLKQTSWMDAESKENTVDKVNSIVEFIGMPGDYFDDSVFENFYTVENFPEYTTNNLFEVVRTHMKFVNDRSYSKLTESTESYRTELFYRLIPRVNAMYSPEDNIMMLPVGILQGLFYKIDRPSYLNYGTLGSIIGHELTHAVGEEGSKLDKFGKEGEIWTKKTKKAFDEVSQCIIEDAEGYDVEDTDDTINGTTTFEENLADFTGIKISYNAYKKLVQKNGEEQPLNGINYTPNQLFWISAISYECYKLSGESLEKALKYGSHALNSFRATGPMRNNPDFAKDFNCPLNSHMNPSKKCSVY